MKASPACAGLLCVTLFAPIAQAACKQGAYASDHGDFVAVVPLPNSQSPGQRYLFRDGRRGSTADGGDASERPLVVMVHGSERTSSLNSPYAYSLAAQGISVFVYDKRGTGASEG